jgi:hypothetical protein
MIIPQTIPECFTFLKVLVDKQSIRNIKGMTREELVDCQHDLGVFIRKNWLYSEKSPLMIHLKELGMEDCEEDLLAALIIEVFWSI